jgi:hypothetical protein
MAIRPVFLQFRLNTLSSHGRIQEDRHEDTICSLSYSFTLYLLRFTHEMCSSQTILTYHVLLMTLFITIAFTIAIYFILFLLKQVVFVLEII